MDADFAEIVGQIYEAALVPERWLVVLDFLARLSNSLTSGLIAASPSGASSYIATEPLASLIQASMATGALARNERPGRAIAKQHAGWMSDLELFTPEEHAAEPIYNAYLRPAGIGYTAGTVLPLPSGDILVFDVSRRTEAGPFDRRTLDRLDRLRPHLARSALISARLGLDFAKGAAEALALLGLPTAVLARDGRVLSVNDLFASMPDARVAIGARDRIGFADKGADALLKEALEAIGTDGTPTVRSIPVAASETSPAFVAHLTPVRRSALDLFGGSLALLIITPVEAPEAPLRQVLTVLFDLTPSEAHVARLLAGGHTVETAAATLAVTQDTVRTHLKRVLAKTGTARQADLVRLLAGTAARSPKGNG
jgi:DNA-binding CsgD family transcriptional regulator